MGGLDDLVQLVVCCRGSGLAGLWLFPCVFALHVLSVNSLLVAGGALGWWVVGDSVTAGCLFPASLQVADATSLQVADAR